MSLKFYDHLQDMISLNDLLFDLLERSDTRMFVPAAEDPGADLEYLQKPRDNFLENIFDALENRDYVLDNDIETPEEELNELLENAGEALTEFENRYRETFGEEQYSDIRKEWYQNAEYVLKEVREEVSSMLGETEISPESQETSRATAT